MDREIWAHEYSRLVTAYNRARNAEQASIYFAALQHYPQTAVHAAVEAAIRESKHWPTAAELTERANSYLAGHQAPASLCHVCHGMRFTVQHCEGYHTPSGKPVPVNPDAVCRRDFPHARHAEAHPCDQCHPAARRAAS